MKIRVTFKDDDWEEAWLRTAAKKALKAAGKTAPKTSRGRFWEQDDWEQWDDEVKYQMEEIYSKLEPWIHGLYVTIEFDTEAGTAEVIKK